MTKSNRHGQIRLLYSSTQITSASPRRKAFSASFSVAMPYPSLVVDGQEGEEVGRRAKAWHRMLRGHLHCFSHHKF